MKMFWTVSWDMFVIGFAGFVMMQTPSRAIFVNTRPLGSTPGIGSREASPMSTRPAAASLMPIED